MKLPDVLCHEAHTELTRNGITELVPVSLDAVPDPEQPDFPDYLFFSAGI